MINRESRNKVKKNNRKSRGKNVLLFVPVGLNRASKGLQCLQPTTCASPLSKPNTHAHAVPFVPFVPLVTFSSQSALNKLLET